MGGNILGPFGNSMLPSLTTVDEINRGIQRGRG